MGIKTKKVLPNTQNDKKGIDPLGTASQKVGMAVRHIDVNNFICSEYELKNWQQLAASLKQNIDN
ncbi:hypothetical protein ACNSO7_26875 [Yersinia enterocolitica]|uniref:hypothetical protein n=1 Tax=Yersinia enterocolitica TaxID=630 RepID=UPI003AB3889A